MGGEILKIFIDSTNFSLLDIYKPIIYIIKGNIHTTSEYVLLETIETDTKYIFPASINDEFTISVSLEYIGSGFHPDKYIATIYQKECINCIEDSTFYLPDTLIIKITDLNASIHAYIK